MIQAGKLILKYSVISFTIVGLLLAFQNCAGGFNQLEEGSSVAINESKESELLQTPSVHVLPIASLVKKSLGKFDLTFQKETGALLQIQHQEAGVLLETTEGDESFFSIATPVAQYLPLSLDTKNSFMSQDIIEDNTTDGRRRLRLIWQNLQTPPDRKFLGVDEVSIRVVVEIIESPAPTEGLEFRLHLQNQSEQKVSVAQVLFPDFRGLRRLQAVGQSIPTINSFRAIAFDRETNPFEGPQEDNDRTVFYPMATWERILLPTIKTDAQGFPLLNAHGVHLSRVFDYNRHYLALLTCTGNGVYLTEQATAEAKILQAEELMHSRDASGPEGLRVAWRRPLNPLEQLNLLGTSDWWSTPIVSLIVSLNGENCP